MDELSQWNPAGVVSLEEPDYLLQRPLASIPTIMSSPCRRYYAVLRGRQGPAIYSTWEECRAQVEGFPRAKYKSFFQYKDAEGYLQGSQQLQSAYFYAVRRGKNGPGIYQTWAECEEQTAGYSGAEYVKFHTREEAQSYIGIATNSEGTDHDHDHQRMSEENPSVWGNLWNKLTDLWMKYT